MRNALTLLLVAASHLAAWSAPTARALEYPYAPYNEGKMDPQKTGWPLTDEERAYVLKARIRTPAGPGSQPAQARAVAGHAVGRVLGRDELAGYSREARRVCAGQPGPSTSCSSATASRSSGAARSDKGVLNEAWKKHFGDYKTINIGIGGDKTQNVLWRLDHGGVEGLAAARRARDDRQQQHVLHAGDRHRAGGARASRCVVANVREKFPQAAVIVGEDSARPRAGQPVLRRHQEDQRRARPAEARQRPEGAGARSHGDFTNADGTLKKALFTPDNIHLSPAGYSVYAERLKPLLDQFLGGKGLGGDVVLPKTKTPAPAPAAAPQHPPARQSLDRGCRSPELAAPAHAEDRRRQGPRLSLRSLQRRQAGPATHRLAVDRRGKSLGGQGRILPQARPRGAEAPSRNVVRHARRRPIGARTAKRTLGSPTTPRASRRCAR